MATTVDEFGRVVPATAPLPSSREASSRGPPPPPPAGGGPPRDRSDRGRSPSPPSSRYGGGGRGRSRGRSRHYHGGSSRDHHHHSSSSRRDYHPHSSGGGEPRGRDREREWRKRPRSPSSSSHHHHHHSSAHHYHHSSRHDSGSPTTTPRSTSRQRHASHRYVEEPMVCEYVWKAQREELEGAKKEGETNGSKDMAAVAVAATDNPNDNQDVAVKKEEEEDDDDAIDNNDNKNNTAATNKDGGDVKEDYDEYRKRYCLNYVRSFFNQHMDDSWFRSRYSPLGKKRTVVAERERAKQEAQVFSSQMETSLQEAATADTTTDATAVAASSSQCSFVKQARLGGGIKTSLSDPPIPATHKFSMADPEHILHITDVPPHITDEQLTLALMDHCTIPADEQAEGSPVPEGIKLVSGTVTAEKLKNPLWREAFFICSPTVKQDIITQLTKAELEGDSSSAAAAAAGANHHDKAASSAAADKSEGKSDNEPVVAVPRKDKDRDDHATTKSTRATLPLDVECSDPYGRLDVDADGKGGAPEDGVGVPPRKSTVWVKTQYKPSPALVLSAAVSSKERLGRDKEAAIMMARALDVAKDIPPELRLDEVIDKLFGQNRNNNEDNSEDAVMTEDTLDIAIAYLRRVHLFSFYNGCTFSNNIADVLTGRHPAGTIHLRLHNADDILAEDNPPSKTVGDLDDSSTHAPPKDLLVSRLDASIASALDQCNQWINSGGATIVNDQVDQEAAELEKAEEEWKDTWLENHAIIDDDGRARCSFHFCHKLFKDKNFLRKHLQKKHTEFLRAEQAQLHDEYMMKAWDEEDQRPVPPVLVDCGANFDLVPSPVVGAQPMAVDPEPELWRKEEERRKREEELREQRQQQRRIMRENPPDRSSHTAGGDERRSAHPVRSAKNFVDVDDMKEEKVEMSFDNVDVPVQPPKKKKKKKKLL